ncbi:MAG: DUF4398 domain-containing protein [Pseudomonadota bacterium]|nr:DUF4398 domain-containing protein [Pseudomonadota bacterium]
MVVMFLGLTSCATLNNAADEKIANAELAISLAQQDNAQKLAPRELRYAQDNLQNAQKAADNLDYQRAARLADRALIDAKWAQTKATSAQLRQAVDELQTTIETLRNAEQP